MKLVSKVAMHASQHVKNVLMNATPASKSAQNRALNAHGHATIVSLFARNALRHALCVSNTVAAAKVLSVGLLYQSSRIRLSKTAFVATITDERDMSRAENAGFNDHPNDV